LPVADDYVSSNVATEQTDPDSMLLLYRRLLSLRRSEPALSIGECRPLELDPEVLAYQRCHESVVLTMLLNFTNEPKAIPWPHLGGQHQLVLSTDARRTGSLLDGNAILHPNEGVVLRRS
jgi:glycosidase